MTTDRKTQTQFNLRDLSQKIRTLSREHPAYWQVSTFIVTCCDAIDAIALCMEQRKEIDALRKKLDPHGTTPR